MPRAPPPTFYIVSAVVLFIWYIVWNREHYSDVPGLSSKSKFSLGSVLDRVTPSTTPANLGPHGDGDGKSDGDGAVMGKLSNETLKADLGRAAWKLFHTTMARFPDKPTKDESKMLKDYIHLFAKLYPCGECSEHFQGILKQYPPQTSSRTSAATWACFVHNEVNKSKGKPMFDCANIGDWYDCGCGDEKKDEMTKAGAQADKVATGTDPSELSKEEPIKAG